MTDFAKIQAYYSVSDEQNRLEQSEGRLEFEISFQLLLQRLEKGARVLDLGGGAGKYAIELAKLGYRATLADLSERLLEQAKQEIERKGLPQLQGVDMVNAIDLHRYADASFDAVILFGPMYHLLEEAERRQCAAEVGRVLRKDGLVFVSFIPYLSGLDGLVIRALYCPGQVDQGNLSLAYETGKFNNNATQGFQEGYYPRSEEIEALFRDAGFAKVLLRSVRGLGHGKEEALYALQNKNPALFRRILELIDATADDPAILETCGHAVYIGRKQPR